MFIEVLSGIDDEWTQTQIRSGLSSGEGICWALRDDEEGGPRDKRLLIVESEFASVLKIAQREGNTLSPTIRNAWDSQNLCILTKNNPVVVRDPHISIVGHITVFELLHYFKQVEMANGFGNRFLWVYSKRTRLRPEIWDSAYEDFKSEILALKEACNFASAQGQIQIAKSARDTWINF